MTPLRRIHDLKDGRFGKLIAIQCVGRDRFGNALWKCLCDCGNESYIPASSLTSGNSTSCGHCPLNIYAVQDGFMIGKTRRGESFLFDIADYKQIRTCNWYIADGYPRTNLGSGKLIFMHRLLMGTKSGMVIDHINRNRLDNRRINLRWVTKSQNAVNSGLNQQNQSGFKGVSYHRLRDKFRARIKVNGREKHLGLFDDPREAAIAYNHAAAFYFGEHAYLNHF